MMNPHCALVAGTLLLLLTSSLAQSNEVSLGQVGDTNTIAIDQTGAGNSVGAASERLRLNQIGDRNEIDIRQFGNNNAVGPIDRTFSPGFLTGLRGEAAGLDQIGHRNRLSIVQLTARGGGQNVVGALLQIAEGYPALATTFANTLSILQRGGEALATGGSGGPGHHFIGEVRQTNAANGGQRRTNSMEIEQIGGGGPGQGHRAETLAQTGENNRLTLRQSDMANSVRSIEQIGSSNTAVIEQDAGSDNTFGNLVQHGEDNAIRARQTGSGNYVEAIRQENASGTARGNNTTLSIIGDDNGGEGIGGYLSLSANQRSLGAFDSAVWQFGDDNSLSFTIGAQGGTGAGASGNLFGFLQDGMGNQLVGAVTGDRNQTYARQLGDGNVLDIRQDGVRGAGERQGNLAAVAQDGDRNSVTLGQTGTGNRIEVIVQGDRNTTGGTARATAGGLLPDGLLPSGLMQRGAGNAIGADILGNANVFAILQTGERNGASATVVGNGNTGYVVQIGNDNVAAYAQYGSGNFVLIEQ